MTPRPAIVDTSTQGFGPSLSIRSTFLFRARRISAREGSQESRAKQRVPAVTRACSVRVIPGESGDVLDGNLTMALIQCPDCGKPDVSTAAFTCPSCGALVVFRMRSQPTAPVSLPHLSGPEVVARKRRLFGMSQPPRQLGVVNDVLVLRGQLADLRLLKLSLVKTITSKEGGQKVEFATRAGVQWEVRPTGGGLDEFLREVLAAFPAITARESESDRPKHNAARSDKADPTAKAGGGPPRPPPLFP